MYWHDVDCALHEAPYHTVPCCTVYPWLWNAWINEGVMAQPEGSVTGGYGGQVEGIVMPVSGAADAPGRASSGIPEDEHAGVDRRLMKLNLVLLLVVAFLPFPTRLLTEFIRDPQAERVATVPYGLWLLLISVTQAGIWRYVSTNHRLLPHDVSQAGAPWRLRAAKHFSPEEDTG